jgi:hypothetical protein
VVEAPRAAEVTRPGSGPHEAARAQEARSSRTEAELENLKIQLAQARRQVELAAIARQSLVEQLDAAQARVDNLEDQVAEQQRRQSASEVGERPLRSARRRRWRRPWRPPPSTRGRTRPRRRCLRCAGELEQARDELRKALGRPVDALERELAELRARLGVSTPVD